MKLNRTDRDSIIEATVQKMMNRYPSIKDSDFHGHRFHCEVCYGIFVKAIVAALIDHDNNALRWAKIRALSSFVSLNGEVNKADVDKLEDWCTWNLMRVLYDLRVAPLEVSHPISVSSVLERSERIKSLEDSMTILRKENEELRKLKDNQGGVLVSMPDYVKFKKGFEDKCRENLKLKDELLALKKSPAAAPWNLIQEEQPMTVIALQAKVSFLEKTNAELTEKIKQREVVNSNEFQRAEDNWRAYRKTQSELEAAYRQASQLAFTNSELILEVKGFAEKQNKLKGDLEAVRKVYDDSRECAAKNIVDRLAVEKRLEALLGELEAANQHCKILGEQLDRKPRTAAELGLTMSLEGGPETIEIGKIMAGAIITTQEDYDGKVAEIDRLNGKIKEVEDSKDRIEAQGNRWYDKYVGLFLEIVSLKAKMAKDAEAVNGFICPVVAKRVERAKKKEQK